MGFYLKNGKYVKYGEEIEVDEERWEKLKKYDNFKRVKKDTNRKSFSK
jgi:hypothetical protein